MTPIPREKLIARRKELGLKRPLLAQMLGISRFHVYNVEGGRRDPSPALMARWTRELRSGIDVWPLEDQRRYYQKLSELAPGMLPAFPNAA